MNIEYISWLKNRKTLIASLIVDICLFLIIIYDSKLSSLIAFDKLIILLNWIIISYVLGRYHFSNKFNFQSITKHIFISTLCLIINIGSYLLIRFFLPFLKNSYFELDYLFLFTTVSLTSNILFSFIFSKYRNKKNKWILWLNEEYYSKFKSEFSDELTHIKITRINNLSDLEDYQISKFNGLVISKENIYELQNSKKNLPYQIKIFSLLNWIEETFNRIPSDFIDKEEIFIEINSFKIDKFQIRLKRVCDLLFSIFLLGITTPLLLICSLLIFLEDRGPILYSQIRNGKNEKKMKIYKLRTMKIDAEKDGASWAKKQDERITKFGNLMRKSRIDELPQLWNVLIGEMSLIGPRPERPQFDEILEVEIPHYKRRLDIRPGLSGWAQVNYPYGSSIKDSHKKLSFDLYYIKNFSFLLDLLIFIKTIRIVITAKGAIPKND